MNSSPSTAPLRFGLTGSRGVLGRSLQIANQQIDWQNFGGDIRDQTAVRDWLRNAEPLDAIVHLAAIVPTGEVEADPARALQINVGGTCNLLAALRDAGTTPWIFLASTSHVYASSTLPLAEDATVSPVSLYGLTKLQAEEWGRAYADRFGLKVCVGRIFSYNSPLQAHSYFIPGLVQKFRTAAPGATIKIPGLNGTRDFLTARQIAETILRLAELHATGSFNIGSGQPVRLLDVADAVRRRVGREDVRIESPEIGTAHLTANVGKLAGIGIAPSFDLERFLDGVVQ
jgi:nucleoside-diphosphate-sugar epimerase